MVTGSGESAPINESDVGDEMPSGLSDMGDESRIVLGDDELPDSSKVSSILLTICNIIMSVISIDWTFMVH